MTINAVILVALFIGAILAELRFGCLENERRLICDT